MSMIRKVMPVLVREVEGQPNRSRFVAATSQLARDGHILEPRGILTDNFVRSGTILFDHDTATPVGTPAGVAINDEGNLEIEIEWAPEGISPEADKVRGLVKAGVLRCGSVGFDPLETSPLDAKRPKGGQHITRCDLLEFSIVSVPADTGAVATQRALKRGEEDWKCGTSRDLPLEDSDEWDGAAAEASIFEWAGGEDFDPSKARKAFLAYNAAKPKLRGSYKLPIAHVIDGRLKVPKGAIRAAASRLSSTDLPEGVKESAHGVINHYQEKAGMAKENGSERGLKGKHTRALERAPRAGMFKRGLYECSQLAYLLHTLGYMHASSEYEEELENDTDSKLPEMLGESLKGLGEALIEMTEEEVTELLAQVHGGEDGEESMTDEDRAYIGSARTARGRAWRRGIVTMRAGKALSAANSKLLERGLRQMDRADAHHESLGEHHAAAATFLQTAGEAHDKAVKGHGELADAIENVKNEPAKATEHVARALKLHRAIAKAHGEVSAAHDGIEDAHADGTDAHSALGRCLDGAQRCMRAVVEGGTTAAEETDGDSKLVQTSKSIQESDGAENGRHGSDYARRQAELRAFMTVA